MKVSMHTALKEVCGQSISHHLTVLMIAGTEMDRKIYTFSYFAGECPKGGR